MKVEVTDKVSGKKMAIDPDKVLLLEPMDGGGSHIVLDPNMGRSLVEDYQELKPFFDVVMVNGAGLKAAMKLKK